MMRTATNRTRREAPVLVGINSSLHRKPHRVHKPHTRKWRLATAGARRGRCASCLVYLIQAEGQEHVSATAVRPPVVHLPSACQTTTAFTFSYGTCSTPVCIDKGNVEYHNCFVGLRRLLVKLLPGADRRREVT